MPGSSTTPGRLGTRDVAPMRVAFRLLYGVGTQIELPFAARWLAYALPYRRFACTFTGTRARLGADAVRYAFIVRDSHPLLLAGFTGAHKTATQLPLTLQLRTCPRTSDPCTLSANCRLTRRNKIHSLYHFVSDCKHARGNDNPKRLGGFDVDR
jgi:hypothetical protein